MGRYTSYCLTQVVTVSLAGSLYLFTASTDGHVALWPLNLDLEDGGEGGTEFCSYETIKGRIQLRPILAWIARFPIYQNCIKCLSIVRLSDMEVLLATAGDDGAIAFSRIVLSGSAKEEASSELSDSLQRDHDSFPSLAIPLISTLMISKAHASAVTALQYLGYDSEDSPSVRRRYRFATSGNDQRLKTWLLSIDMAQPGVEGFAVAKGQNVTTAVADIAAMDIVESDEERAQGVVIAGIGLECWSI